MIDITNFDLSDLGPFLKRRALWILAPFALGCGISILAVKMTEPTYEASTTILVEEQKVPSTYVRTTVTTSLGERLKSLNQQVTNRDSLEQIIVESDLYDDLRGEVSLETLVAKLRRDLDVRVLPGQLFKITLKGADPDSVASAVNGIADKFIEENLRWRARHAANTTEFLEGELQKTRATLEQKEADLVGYRVKNDGALPEQQPTNFNAIEQLQTKLQINQSEIEQAQLRKTLLARDRRDNSVVLNTRESQGPSRLEELQLELNALRSKFTANHPDVIRIQSEIDQLRLQQPEGPGSSSIEEEDLRLDPQVEAELVRVGSTLARLESERDRLLQQIATYQARLERTPRIEQQLTILTRDYDNLRDFYESLLSKRIEARLAEDLERQQQSEQFRKLEEARPPAEPISPNPPLYLIVGAFLGGVVGIGLAFIRERTDETFDSEEAVRKAFPGIPFIVSIPHLSALEDEPATTGTPMQRTGTG